MVSNFRRSLSYANPKDPKQTASISQKPTSSHIRSTSLPCRSHPLISQLKDNLIHLKSSWAAAGSKPDTAWLCDGLALLKTVHDYLDDILHLPQTQDSLRRNPDWIEKLLEDFLRFVDAYGIFQTLVFALKQEHSAAQVAVRKKDESKIEMYAKAMRKMEKEMSDLVSTVGCITRINSTNNFICNVDAELVEVILDVKDVTVLVSTVLFSGISSSLVSKKPSWIGLRLGSKGRVEEGIQEFKQVGTECCLWGLRKKGDEEVRMVLKRMSELEDCIVKIEIGSEKVFRSLINTRVSLLNVLT
ncbi:hypothetical protein Vadar_030785 [Vaccinium darrowii]|uniref:Uncharacterized protein n=1 Tax=Vaccinium darrowii TaxID=229202 RepID=A0ACB7Y371_9ERIC|nr:hypothetical protein Vadar_030785 [Vaccinium darrowii]